MRDSSIQSEQTARRFGEVELLEAQRLQSFPWLVHGFTTRNRRLEPPASRRSRPGRFSAGELNLGYSVGDEPTVVSRNRQQVVRALDAEGLQLVTLRQRHSDAVELISSWRLEGRKELDGAVQLAGDALITTVPGLLLAVQVADCLPILLVDPDQHAIAAVHAGWRGTLKRIAEKTVGRMRQQIGSKAEQMLAIVGPGIQRCCYEVGREVAEALEGRFADWEAFVHRTEASPSQVHWQQPLIPPPLKEARPRSALTAPSSATFHLDLVEANRRQLEAAGVPASEIWPLPFCTACRTDRFYSHRAERGRAGRMMGLIGLVR